MAKRIKKRCRKGTCTWVKIKVHKGRGDYKMHRYKCSTCNKKTTKSKIEYELFNGGK